LPSHREIDDDAVVATRAKLEAMREAVVHALIGEGIDGASLALLGSTAAGIAALDAMPIEASSAARVAASTIKTHTAGRGAR